ncbi:MAG: hypothetical protein ACRECA_01515 [Pseudolabrys sp.]
MIERPCRANTDLKQIWRLLLPDTPFPACGAPEGSDTKERDDAAAARSTENPPSDLDTR